MPTSRRDVLKIVPALVSARALPGLAGTPEMRFPTVGRDRLAVTSYPFRAYIDSPGNKARKADLPGMDITEFPAFVAQKFGVKNINPLGAHFASTDDAYLVRFRQALEKAGSHIVDLGLGGGYFYDSAASVRDNALVSSRKWIEIAAKVGSPSVRQHLQVRTGQKPDVANAAEGLSRLAEYGAERNVVVNLENDNALAEDPFVLVAVIEKVNSPYLRALPDFGNSLIGHDADYSQRGVKAMLGHAWNMCHVKDLVQSESGQLERVDLAGMFKLARQSSYRGYYSMEFDTDAGDPIVGTQKLVEESLQYLG